MAVRFDPPPGGPAPHPGRGAALFGWGGLALVVVLGAASSGFSGAAMFFGLYVGVVAVVALARGRVGWARLPSRHVAGAALAGAVTALVAGAITAPAAPSGGSRVGLASDGTSANRTASQVTAPPQATSSATAPTGSASPSPPGARPPVGTALALLDGLAVKGRAPRTGYERSAFGAAWTDTDHNGCDQRNDVLRRDLAGTTLKAGTGGCTVLTGALRDPYTGRTIAFVRSSGAAAVQIDHVVALADAWVKGAQSWVPAKRVQFANDPLNLLAVGGSVNAAKGDGDAATWLPPVKGYRCAYVARQVAVKAKYGVWVTAAERQAMGRILVSCPGQRPPASAAIALGGAPVAGTAPAPRPVPSRTPPAVPRPRPTGTTSTVQGVHPGAFCSPAGALGVTTRGTPMRCSYKTGDPRARWRAA